MKQELETATRLVNVHKQLLAVNQQRITDLSTAILNCDVQFDLEMSKIDSLGSTTLLNTKAASQRLRDLRQRREQLALEIVAAQNELAKVQRVIELLSERRVGLLTATEAEETDEMIESWISAKTAS